MTPAVSLFGLFLVFINITIFIQLTHILPFSARTNSAISCRINLYAHGSIFAVLQAWNPTHSSKRSRGAICLHSKSSTQLEKQKHSCREFQTKRKRVQSKVQRCLYDLHYIKVYTEKQSRLGLTGCCLINKRVHILITHKGMESFVLRGILHVGDIIFHALYLISVEVVFVLQILAALLERLQFLLHIEDFLDKVCFFVNFFG